MAEKIITYVLAPFTDGNFPDNFIESSLNKYRNRSDVVILQGERGESIEDVAGKIYGPAHVILQAHGLQDGTFHWSRGWNGLVGAGNNATPYSQLFSALPRTGIVSITITSCYGGSAQAESMLRAAPPGTPVLSIISPMTISTSDQSSKFAQETVGLRRPVDLYLEALDNFHTKIFADYLILRKKTYGENEIIDPEQALPHIIGLGGNPPLRVDLNKQLKTLQGYGRDPAFQRAIGRVQASFDTDEFHGIPGKPYHLGPDGSLGAAAEKALDGRIAAMGQKLAQGEAPQGVEERRLAYAITAAYLDESGKLQAMIKQQPGYMDPFTKLDANGNPIDPNNLLHRATEAIFGPLKDWAKHTYNSTVKGITAEEQAYINYVATKIEANPAMRWQLDGVLRELVTSFSQSKDNDQLTPNSRLVKTLHQAGISTKSWER